MKPRILIIDTDTTAGQAVRTAVSVLDCDVQGPQPLSELDEASLVLLTPPEGKLASATVARIRERFPRTGVIVLTGWGSTTEAVDCLKAGAMDYVERPVTPERLAQIVGESLNRLSMLVPAEPIVNGGPSFVLGSNPAMNQAVQLLDQVAPLDVGVLLTGPTGSGKSRLARRVHERSSRSTGPFVEVSCAALGKELLESELFGHVRGAFTGADQDRRGRFELAEGGTLFLDEINSATPALQARLLRILQEGTFEPVGSEETRSCDVRVLAAGNRDLHELASQGGFREDLLWRLAVVEVDIPSLSARMDDLPLLAHHMCERYAHRLARRVDGLDPSAMEVLMSYTWPGNVRELEHAIARAVAVTRGPLISAVDLPPRIQRPTGHPAVQLAGGLQQDERERIEAALAAHQQNRTQAAVALGIHRASLYKKMKRLGIS
ncbi:MAG: sigma-54 dependent transcriptional regulator [Planctomycetota bacterium]